MGKLLKWLSPGLRIKRWILVIFLGLMFAICASGALFFYFVHTTDGDRVTGAKLLTAVVLGFCLSAFCLITGPNKEAVIRVHEKAGHPAKELYELSIQTA